MFNLQLNKSMNKESLDTESLPYTIYHFLWWSETSRNTAIKHYITL